MSIVIYKVNNLFTIKRVSVYDRWMKGQIDGMFQWGREQDVVWDGMVWGGEIGWDRVGQCGVMIGWGLGDGGVKSGLRSGLRRLCVVCATTETCCKCNNFIQNHAPGQS